MTSRITIRLYFLHVSIYYGASPCTRSGIWHSRGWHSQGINRASGLATIVCPILLYVTTLPGYIPMASPNIFFCLFFKTIAFIWGKAMATHSSTLAWKISWAEEPGRLQSMGSRRVGHDCATSLSRFTFTFHFHALEKEMATHSSILAWRIPGAAEPGGLLSVGSHRVRHDWSDLAAAAV